MHFSWLEPETFIWILRSRSISHKTRQTYYLWHLRRQASCTNQSWDLLYRNLFNTQIYISEGRYFFNGAILIVRGRSILLTEPISFILSCFLDCWAHLFIFKYFALQECKTHSLPVGLPWKQPERQASLMYQSMQALRLWNGFCLPAMPCLPACLPPLACLQHMEIGTRPLESTLNGVNHPKRSTSPLWGPKSDVWLNETLNTFRHSHTETTQRFNLQNGRNEIHSRSSDSITKSHMAW